MINLFSPAKINLFLRVVGKRPDGYHDLSSVFQTISLGDQVTMGFSDGDRLTCTDPDLPTDGRNLALKALYLFRSKTDIRQCFHIHLKKKIPCQAGLGGGSSNAATVLWGCNQLLKTNVPAKDLSLWAAEIGSDISFFFSEGTAYCTGRGEQVENLPPLPPRRLVIVKPPYGLSTPEVYGRFRLQATRSQKDDVKAFLEGSLTYFNDLEAPAFEIKPELKILKTELLSCGFEHVVMTGSGSAFYCLGDGSFPDDPRYKTFACHITNRTNYRWFQENA